MHCLSPLSYSKHTVFRDNFSISALPISSDLDLYPVSASILILLLHGS